MGTGFGLALVVALALPRLTRGGSAPPVRVLVLTGALIALVTTGALFLTVRRDLGLPVRVASVSKSLQVPAVPRHGASGFSGTSTAPSG